MSQFHIIKENRGHNKMIKYLEIHGLRGFGECQKVNFAIPSSHKRGSGLTILVGANNTRKKTIIEYLI